VTLFRRLAPMVLLTGPALAATLCAREAPGGLALLASPQSASPSGIETGASPAGDRQSGAAQVSFSYENPQLQPAKYVLVVQENGSGHYQSETGSAVLDHKELPVRAQDRPIQISPATRNAIFAAARHSKYFSISCDSGATHIAFQGKKTLEYNGPDGHGSCTYNWSKDKQIGNLTDTFQGVAATLEEGAKLEVEYEHSRLSLDTELELLTGLVHDGRALELNNIAPILKKIAEDDAILKRAQRRAQDLLANTNSTTPH
jgi:hypothetical protein